MFWLLSYCIGSKVLGLIHEAYLCCLHFITVDYLIPLVVTSSTILLMPPPPRLWDGPFSSPFIVFARIVLISFKHSLGSSSTKGLDIPSMPFGLGTNLMYCFSAYDFSNKNLIDCNTLALNIECISELLILIIFEVDVPYILITHACPNFRLKNILWF